jgi:hypothetical protein
MVLGGDGGHVQILSRGARPFVKTVDKDGRKKVLTATPDTIEPKFRRRKTADAR